MEEEDSAEEVGISYLQSRTIDKGKQDKEESGGIHTMGQFTPKYTVQVQIAGQPMKIVLDTGAVVSVISEEWYQRHLCQYSTTGDKHEAERLSRKQSESESSLLNLAQ